MLLLYKFFDYKYNIEGFTSDLFGIQHIVYIILAFVSVITLAIVFRNASHKKVDIFLKILSILMVVFEITKISWESYWDISTGRGFNYAGLLPLYTCSLFIYTLLCVAWSKKGSAIYEYSLSFITTIGLLSGAIGAVYCNGLNFYPFWTFGAWYSLMFHYIMFATGVFLLACKYKILEWNDIVKGWIPMVILALFALPANCEYNADYMQLHEGSGVPLFSSLAKIMAGVNLRWLFSIIMLCAYMILSCLVVSVYKLIVYICEKSCEKTRQNIENQPNNLN